VHVHSVILQDGFLAKAFTAVSADVRLVIGMGELVLISDDLNSEQCRTRFAQKPKFAMNSVRVRVPQARGLKHGIALHAGEIVRSHVNALMLAEVSVRLEGSTAYLLAVHCRAHKRTVVAMDLALMLLHFGRVLVAVLARAAIAHGPTALKHAVGDDVHRTTAVEVQRPWSGRHVLAVIDTAWK